MAFKREQFDPSEYAKSQRLKAKTVNQLIKAAEQQSAFFTPSGLSGEIGQLARLVSRMLIRRVEFTEALASGSSALAKLSDWKGSDYDVDNATEFPVYDGLGGQTTIVGDTGYAVYMADRGEWELLSRVGGARRGFKLRSDLVEDGSALAWLVEGSSGPTYTVTSTTFTVHSGRCLLYGDQGTLGLAEYWPDTGCWEAYQMLCVPEDDTGTGAF